ncbi:MAG: ABC transporter ATP-binding protein [Coriobacteriales bacterium]
MEIALDHISLAIKKTQILDDVSFEVHDGELVSLLGESGAGKSTIVKLIAGLEYPSEGRVLFDGEDVEPLPTHKRQTAIVFQDIRLFPNMNVRDNVAFPLKMKKVKKAQGRKRADELLELVQLEGFGDRQVSELSGGQQQRVALARALAAEPRALLLDEPFSGLDESLRDDMRTLVSSLHEKLQMTTLMVTHDAVEAVTMSDRVIYLSKGKVVQVATPDELCLHPANEEIARSFGASSVIEGIVKDGVFTSGKLVLPAKGTHDGPAVYVRAGEQQSFIRELE